jgi:ABC transporter with metal-binding/Fe-S-binding domain ATP-binding protein
MFHFPAVRWTKLQARALGIHQEIVSTEGVKEKELEDLKRALSQLRRDSGIEAVVSGAVASEYQKTRLEYICEDLNLKSYAPLWHKNQEYLVKEQIDSGFEIIVTACSALGLDESWLGKRLGNKELRELVKLKERYGLSVAFEGGEAETFALAGPPFKGRLSIIKSTPHWKQQSGYLELNEVRLES